MTLWYASGIKKKKHDEMCLSLSQNGGVRLKLWSIPCWTNIRNIRYWLVVWNILYVPMTIGFMSSSQLTKSYFSGWGRYTTTNRDIYDKAPSYEATWRSIGAPPQVLYRDCRAGESTKRRRVSPPRNLPFLFRKPGWHMGISHVLTHMNF